MKKILVLILFLPFFFSVHNAHAQKRLALTLQGGYGTGGYEATHTGINLGKFAFRADLNYLVLPILDAYAAFSYAGFACGEEAGGFCKDARVDFTASGLNVGLRLKHLPNASIWIPWFRAGLAYQMLKWSRLTESYSDAGLGFEIGTGIAYPVTEQ